MRVGVLGTGVVGRTIATKLLELGHAVMMGSRSAQSEALGGWLNEVSGDAAGGTFAEVASSAELVFNCTAGGASLDALAAAGADSLAGKTLVDVANPLDFSKGMPPLLTVCNGDSLGEQIQAAYPQSRVVKALNTVNHLVMIDPARVPGDHDIFICGDEEGAKLEVAALLESFGWPRDSILDLGDISGARGMEMYLPLWLRFYGTFDTGDLNIKVRRAS